MLTIKCKQVAQRNSVEKIHSVGTINNLKKTSYSTQLKMTVGHLDPRLDGLQLDGSRCATDIETLSLGNVLQFCRVRSC